MQPRHTDSKQVRCAVTRTAPEERSLLGEQSCAGGEEQHLTAPCLSQQSNRAQRYVQHSRQVGTKFNAML